jgi:hypothetical protein
MWPSRGSVRACIATVVLCGVSGCTFEDGDPWGRADLDLSVSWAPESSRLDDAGRLKTALGYAVAIDALEVVLGPATLELAADGAQVAFDPANPPPQYSLCHNGHCHHDDGRLVDYEDIILELGGGTGAGPSIALLPDTEPVAPDADGVPVPIVQCDDACRLPRGRLRALGIQIERVRIRGVAFDADGDRIDADGIDLDLDLDLDLALTALVDGRIDRGEPVGVRVAVALPLTAKLMDAINWADAPDDSAVAEAIATTLEEETALEVRVSRFD